MATVMLSPVYPPYCCIVCGVGGRNRKWFADLNLAIDNYFNPVNDGAIYVCNECWDGMVRAVGHQAQVLMLGQEPWDSRIEITYAEEGELITSAPVGILEPTQEEIEQEDNGPGISSEGSGELNFTTTGDDPTSTNITSEPDTDTTTTTEPVREFREFFGKPV